MSRPHSASQRPKKIYLGNKFQDKNKNINNPDYLPNILYKQQNNYDLKEESFDEELYLLQNSWNELGITPEYRTVFINLAKRVSEAERTDIFMQEKINLKKFKDSLLNLKKEIANRENNLLILRKLDKTMEAFISNENNSNSIDSILKDAINIIKTLRINAVNIVSKIIKVNQISAYYSNSGKFDVSRIKPEYSYEPTYLFKMKNDLFFLKTSTLSTFIEMNNSEIDAFLTNCAPAPNKLESNQKVKIPISDDLMKLITESRYALLQETVLANVGEGGMRNRKIDLYYVENNRRNEGKFRNVEEEQFKYNQNKPIFFVNNNIKKKNNFYQSQNMSKYIYDLKNVNGANRYNNLFYKNNNQQSNNFRLKSAKKKLSTNNNNFGSQGPNSNYNSFFQGKKIAIEHEVIQSLTNQQFMEKLGKYKDKGKNPNEQITNEEMEMLKIENKNFADQIIELKKNLENMEKKMKNEEEKRENLENKYKELSKRAKEYQNELDKNGKEKKKKEFELNKKIEIMEKEKEKYENEKKENQKKKEEKIKNLENSLKKEEEEKKNKEKEIEALKNQLKEEKEGRDKEKMIKEEEDKRREEENKIKNEMDQRNKDKENEEKKNLEEKITKLEDEIKKREQIIKEKEEENQKILLEKSNSDDEIIKLKNELEQLKEENSRQKNEIEKLTEENSRQKNEIEKLKEENSKQENEIEKLTEENSKQKNEIEKLTEENSKQKNEIEKLTEENKKLKEKEEQRLKEEEEKLKKEEEEKQRLMKLEEERIKKEEERLKKLEEERLRKEEEEEKIKLEQERLKKEEEERLKIEEEERLKKEEEERLKIEEEERLKKEEEERKKEDKVSEEKGKKESDGDFVQQSSDEGKLEEDDKNEIEEQNMQKVEEKKDSEEQNINNAEEDKNKEDDQKIQNEEVKSENELKPENQEEERNEDIPNKEEEEKNEEQNKPNEEEEINDNEKKSETEVEKPTSIIPFNDYKVSYYTENLSNLTNSLMELIPIETIPDFLQKAFLLNELIYTEDYYFKGIFPKIIVSTEGGDSTKIKGLCSFYYENNENLKENLIIRINSIFAIDNYELQIPMMIDFIKKNVKFNRIEIYILYDKIEDKFLPNEEAKEIFQKKLGFKWLCVVRDEKRQQRYIKLYYDNENNIDTNDNNDENKLQNNFTLDSLSIVIVNNEEDTYTLKNIINTKSNNNSINKKSYNKYINPNAVYSLILNNSKIKKEFKNKKIKDELEEMNNLLWRFILMENDWNIIEDEKKKIKNINFDKSQSLYKEIEKFYMTKEINCLCDLYKINLSINFETNYSIIIDDIYYNKISTDKIKILKEKKTKSTFFLIPSNDNTTFFYISELNKKLKEFLIDSKQNVYEKFLEFQPSTQKELVGFSNSSCRDITYIPQVIKKSSKTVYIPTFSIKTHLFSYNFKDVEKNVEMIDMNTNTQSHLTSVDEFINIQFKPDNNIDKSFTIVPVEGGDSDFIIKDPFIIGIFDNDIINDEKLPLIQFLYITKDQFITKYNITPN